MARPAADRFEVRERILDAAEDLLGRFGYRKMTVDDLAAAAGLSKGAIYLHFQSKEDIALARIDRVIGELLVELERLARSELPAAKRLREMLITRVLFRLDRVRSYRETIDQLVAAIRTRLLEARREHHRREAELFAAVVRDGIRSHELRPCVAKRAGEALVVATNALLPADLRPEEIDTRQVRRRVETIADLFLHGIVLPPRGKR
ncbi:MAG TPA: TetR/AcrR family transcriptional regulator [Thermoanaerobaculia bacterium]|nr:TetR/AcrR family transcriptional regulator [Thermoanaerobaculia bacterium]